MSEAPATQNRFYSAARGFSNGEVWKRADDDWYQEAQEVTLRLLDVERFPGPIWDPACGGGNVVFACQRVGLGAFGTDKMARWEPLQHAFGLFRQIDFFEPSIDEHVGRPGAIISNPPYKLVEPFILRSLDHAEFKVAFLLRTAFLEGKGRHERIFSKTPLARIWQFRDRISVPPGGADIKPKGGAVAYAWFVWEKGWRGPPHLGWL